MVMAAPNQCEIKAKVIRIEQSREFESKWYFDIEILETKDLLGPNFAHIGHINKGFTFEEVLHISSGSVISAQAEFLGDERGGQFQLTQIKIID